MMYEAATPIGIGFRLLASSPDDAAARVVPGTVIGNERAFEDLATFVKDVDVLTFDHEHVPSEHLRALEASGTAVRPGPDALVHAQDKAVMRERLTEISVPCPRFRVVADPADAAQFADQTVGWPLVLKTARGGYDGKGVWTVEGATDPALAEPFRAGVRVVAEERVEFVRELAAVVARSPQGQAVAYPVVESVQRDGICVEVTAPAPGLSDELAVQAEQLALTVAKELDVVGVLAVELFETRDSRLLVNELAMRPHNSGHWTMEGAETSQFENHLRAVLDLPLGSPRARAPWTVMVNVLGGDLDEIYSAYRHVMARDPGARIHWYGKRVRPGRKVGHVTVCGADLEDVRQRARHAAAFLAGEIDE